ncbi:MAG: DNA-binding transcriptional regulator [Treponemataceae bacterium]
MRTIELRIGLEDAYGRATTRGVIRYAKNRGDWKLYGAVRRDFGGNAAEETPAGNEARRPDGIIARIESAEDAAALAALGIPVVDVAGAYPNAGHASGEFLEANNDDFLTGRRAGEYLRSLGFKRFAFCGITEAVWSKRRKQGFAEAVGVSQEKLGAFERSLGWWKDIDRDEGVLRRMLQTLTYPAALFAGNDVAGLKIAESCRRAGIAVPDQIAVLGVDDEDLLCELADPSLSSVRLDCEGIGKAAAELLDQAMRGETGERKRITAPREVIERESTRIMVADDESASRVLSWIRANAMRGADVGDLAAAFPVSRRALERRFKAAWGLTPHEAIIEARLEHARRLLTATDLTLDSVAQASGFGGLQRFHIAFKDKEGMTPGAWRKANRRR